MRLFKTHLLIPILFSYPSQNGSYRGSKFRPMYFPVEFLRLSLTLLVLTLVAMHVDLQKNIASNRRGEKPKLVGSFSATF